MARNLLALAKTTRQLDRVPSQIARPLADRFNVFLQEGFDTGTDPYGNAWAPLAAATLAKGRFPPPLTDTRAMRALAILIPSSGSGLELMPQKSYGQRHMTGTPNMPQRRYFPDSGLPSKWRAAIADELHKKTEANFNG